MRSFIISSYIFVSQSILQQFIILLLEAVYQKSNNSQIICLLFGRDTLKKHAYKWLLYLSPCEPDLSLTMALPFAAFTAFSILYMYMKFLFYIKPHRDPRSFSYYIYKQNPSKEIYNIEMNLDDIIDDLIWSNRNYRNRLIFDRRWNSDKIGELARESLFLMKLKQDKFRIWPQNRASDEWVVKLKLLMVVLCFGAYIAIYLFGEIVMFQMMISNKNYRKFNKITRKESLLSRKLSLELVILPFFLADWFASEFPLAIVSVIDNLILVSSMKKLALNFIKYSNLYKLQMIAEPYGSYKKRWIRSRCNELLIMCYVSFKFQLKMIKPIVDNVSYYVGKSLLLIVGVSSTVMYLLEDFKSSEIIIFYLVLAAVMVNINGIIAVCAYHYTFCLKNLKKLNSFLGASVCDIYSSEDSLDDDTRLKQSKQNDLLVSSHTFMLWQRLINDRELVSRRFAVLLGGVFIVTYKLAIQINLILTYVIMQFIIYRG